MEEFDCQKIVFSSSSCVYGDPEYLPVDENHPTGKNCANPYGRSKYITEEIMKDISKANGVSFLLQLLVVVAEMRWFRMSRYGF